MTPAGPQTDAMSIIDEIPGENVAGLDEQPACSCRPEYVRRRDGKVIHRHRIDPFCPLHGRHFRREIASNFCRAFNRRRFFSNFIVHLGAAEDPALESWAKEYIRSLIKKHFDKDAIIKSVLHPKKGDRHLQFGVGSDVGHVTLAALMNAKSPRGRRPRLDLSKAWVDGYRRDQIWNWCAYVLRVDEPWRSDEKIERQTRRRWRSRAEPGERINAPTFTGTDDWYGADDVVVDDEGVDDDVDVDADKGQLGEVDEVHVIDADEPNCQVNWPSWCLVPALRWLARKWLKCHIQAETTPRCRISRVVRGKQDGDEEEGRARLSPVTPLARPPPPTARPPPNLHLGLLCFEDMMSSEPPFTWRGRASARRSRTASTPIRR